MLIAVKHIGTFDKAFTTVAMVLENYFVVPHYFFKYKVYC